MKTKRKAARGPTVTVNPKKCTTHPPGEVHAEPKSRRGFVNFNATAPCTIVFKNSSVFDRAYARLKQGNNKRSTETEHGHTFVLIKGCEDKMPRSLGAASGPTDIIVP